MKIVSFLVLIGLLASCQPADPKDDLNTEIKGLEAEIKKDAQLDTALARKLTTAYLEFAELHPKDSLAPYYLSKAADIYKEMPGQSLKAVNLYNKVNTTYPEHPMAARAVFMIGYVFDDRLHDKERASKSYAHFLSQYPDHPLAGDARNLYEMLQDTLSEEERVEMWMKKNKMDTNTNTQ